MENIQQKYGLTPLSEWVTIVGTPMKLPSGKVVLVRPVSNSFMFTSQNVPNVLLKQVQDYLIGETDAETSADKAEVAKRLAKEASKKTPEERIEMIKSSYLFTEAILYEMLVWPKVVVSNPNIENGEITPSAISDEDREFLQSLYGLPEAEILRFHEGEN